MPRKTKLIMKPIFKENPMGTAKMRHSFALLLTVGAVSWTISGASASVWNVQNGLVVAAIGGTHDLTATAIGGTHDAASSAIGGTHETIVSAAASSIEVTEEGIRIYGQLFSASEDTAYAVNLLKERNFNILEATVGFSNTDGSLLITSIRDTGELYVPGASFVRLLGTVGNVIGGIAKFQIGGQLLDYSSLLGRNPDISLSKNQWVIVTGTQPVYQGEILVRGLETY